ncbi:hypothetical protein OBBRIDRAFT_796562 [Obba rivulosa]|uniref:Uncharacterized protein n=1 Tax=Obba rivulosa TaxID=1052685 RepID=A0A8E2DGG3_9APHY|nr:hypothetical protein OBBRIDRAFT_796562 [Obba rivulosa]
MDSEYSACPKPESSTPPNATVPGQAPVAPATFWRPKGRGSQPSVNGTAQPPPRPPAPPPPAPPPPRPAQ